MPDRDEILSTVESYVKFLGAHDVDRLVALFADDAVQHEPLGARTYRGVNEIREFDTACAKVDFTVSLHSPITVGGRFAAAQLRIRRAGMPDFLSTDLFEFDDECRIVSLQVVIDTEAQVGTHR